MVSGVKGFRLADLELDHEAGEWLLALRKCPSKPLATFSPRGDRMPFEDDSGLKLRHVKWMRVDPDPKSPITGCSE
jgi:hypothetical protein